MTHLALHVHFVHETCAHDMRHLRVAPQALVPVSVTNPRTIMRAGTRSWSGVGAPPLARHGTGCAGTAWRGTGDGSAFTGGRGQSLGHVRGMARSQRCARHAQWPVASGDVQQPRRGDGQRRHGTAQRRAVRQIAARVCMATAGMATGPRCGEGVLLVVTSCCTNMHTRHECASRGPAGGSRARTTPRASICQPRARAGGCAHAPPHRAASRAVGDGSAPPRGRPPVPTLRGPPRALFALFPGPQTAST